MRVLQLPWPLPCFWSEEEGIAQALGQELGKTGKILYNLGNVLNFPMLLCLVLLLPAAAL